MDRHCRLARKLATGLSAAGYTVLNDLELNQVVFRLDSDAATRDAHAAAVATGRLWFGPTVWQGRPALRMSVSSWQTGEEHIDRAVAILAQTARRTRMDV